MYTEIVECERCKEQSEYNEALRNGWLVATKMGSKGLRVTRVRCPKCVVKYAIWRGRRQVR